MLVECSSRGPRRREVKTYSSSYTSLKLVPAPRRTLFPSCLPSFECAYDGVQALSRVIATSGASRGGVVGPRGLAPEHQAHACSRFARGTELLDLGVF